MNVSHFAHGHIAALPVMCLRFPCRTVPHRPQADPLLLTRS